MEEQEDAAELQFGKDFADSSVCTCITNDEAFALLNTRMQDSHALAETVTTMQAFLQRVVTTKIQDDLLRLSQELSEELNNIQLERNTDRQMTRLNFFEIASLENLVKSEDTNAEEVLNWIPSLSRFDTGEVEKLIQIVVNAKQKVLDASLG